jgi:hypothetical protein
MLILPHLKGLPTGTAGSNAFKSAALDLNFSTTKSLIDSVSGNNLVTFTRASTGTYVGSDGLIKTATTNEPRFDHNPTTGESLGLLVEEPKTNNLVQSEDFSTTWGPTLVTVSPNTVTAPDGTLTADTFGPVVGDGLTSPRFLRQNPVLTTQQAYTFSVFVKVGTATTNGIALYISDSPAAANFRSNFNLFNQTVSPASATWATPTATIVPYPNGWYRCILSGVTSTPHTGLRANIYLNTFGNTSDTYGTHHIWGAQLEAGAFPTSYILNVNTPLGVTRAADVANITGSNFSSFYNQTEGTVFADSIQANITPVSRIVSASDNTTSNRISLTRASASSGNINLTVTNAGTAQVAGVLLGSSLVAGTSNKVAAGYKAADFAGSVNGLASVTQGTGTVPGSLTQLTIGNGDVLSNNPMNGTIKRLVYWGQRLPNNVLQAITQ